MRSSFRARLTFLSVGVSGLVLAVFALSAWMLAYRIGLRQIDRDITDRMTAILLVPHPIDHWPWIAGALQLSYGRGSNEGCLVLVKGVKGETLHQSANWPQDLSVEWLPPPRPNNPQLQYPPGTAPPPMLRSGGQAQPANERPPWFVLPLTPPSFVTRRAWRSDVAHLYDGKWGSRLSIGRGSRGIRGRNGTCTERFSSRTACRLAVDCTG